MIAYFALFYDPAFYWPVMSITGSLNNILVLNSRIKWEIHISAEFFYLPEFHDNLRTCKIKKRPKIQKTQ